MKQKLKNVVIVNDSNFISGGEDKVAIQSANMLVEKFNDINVYFFSNNNIDESPLNTKVINVRNDMIIPFENKNKLKGALNGLYSFKTKRKLTKFLKELNNEETIIHVHSWSKSITSCVFDVASKLHFKFVLTMHDYFTACPNGGFYNYQKQEICHLKPCSIKCICCDCDSRNYIFKVYRIIRQYIFDRSLRNLKYVISISDFSENIQRKFLPKGCKVFSFYNPIDLEKVEEKIDPARNNWYLYVGRISKEKGVDIFCDCITSVGLQGVVVGDGDYRKELEAKYKNINFLGWKNSREVKNIMKKARCLIIPSKWYECAPLTPLEAMQFGIPIISSDNNATIDYLKKDIGLTYSSKDELKKIIKMCESDEIIKKYSTNAFNYIKKEWANKKYVEELNSIYNNILSD